MRKVFFGLAVLLSASLTQAAVTPITGWIVHNGTSTQAGTNSNPTFTSTNMANISLMAPFSDVTLANDGDYVEVQTTLTLTNRSVTGVNSLDTQLRFGLFDDSANSSLTASDHPNVGFDIVYSNTAQTPSLNEQASLSQTNPFNSVTAMSSASIVPDPNGGSIQGKNPGAVTFDLKLTRDAGQLDLSGTVSGTDSVKMLPYIETFAATKYTSANFPSGGSFAFNRIGLYLGNNVGDGNAALASSSVATNTPEPASFLLVLGLAGGMLSSRRPRRL